jgi:hypothetical protein
VLVGARLLRRAVRRRKARRRITINANAAPLLAKLLAVAAVVAV